MNIFTEEVLIGIIGTVTIAVTLRVPNALFKLIRDSRDSRKIYFWLKNNTTDKAGERFKSTIEISGNLNIHNRRVYSLCIKNPKIFLNKRCEDQWSIYEREEKSVYEERGVIVL